MSNIGHKNLKFTNNYNFTRTVFVHLPFNALALYERVWKIEKLTERERECSKTTKRALSPNLSCTYSVNQKQNDQPAKDLLKLSSVLLAFCYGTMYAFNIRRLAYKWTNKHFMLRYLWVVFDHFVFYSKLKKKDLFEIGFSIALCNSVVNAVYYTRTISSCFFIYLFI